MRLDFFNQNKSALRIRQTKTKVFKLSIVSDEKYNELVINPEDNNEFANLLENLARQVRKGRLKK